MGSGLLTREYDLPDRWMNALGLTFDEVPDACEPLCHPRSTVQQVTCLDERGDIDGYSRTTQAFESLDAIVELSLVMSIAEELELSRNTDAQRSGGGSFRHWCKSRKGIGWIEP